ncbi:hypothetical protein LPC08_17455 [Roseomonas sp. OT10]|uniref:hypothetical protein n=1 Tax=Roseomonas cutis TaxID=2897332 RepID=UPI001E2DE1B1|nr:hypothetical protein [Roseomonas sp. OT10]UFN47787.1 hypothetical protein LPC08_17455 [Roseomonas sp. OT10]
MPPRSGPIAGRLCRLLCLGLLAVPSWSGGAAAQSGTATAPPPRLSDYILSLAPCGYAGPGTRSCTMQLDFGPGSGPPAAAAARRSRRAAEAEARRRAAGGDLAGALALIPESGHLRAHLRRAAGDLPGALAELQRIESSRPSDVPRDVLADLCAVRFRLGDRAGAVRACDRAAEGAEYAGRTTGYALLVSAGLGLAAGDLSRAERDLAAFGRRQGPHSPWPLEYALSGWVLAVRAGATGDVAAARLLQPQGYAEVFELFGVAPLVPPGLATPGPVPGPSGQGG